MALSGIFKMAADVSSETSTVKTICLPDPRAPIQIKSSPNVDTFNKSGLWTHWMWEMVNMQLNNNIETIPNWKEAHMMELAPISELDGLPSQRVFNPYLRLRNLPEYLKRKHCQIMYLLQDPRDVTVSYYKLQLAHAHYDYTGKWHDCFLCFNQYEWSFVFCNVDLHADPGLWFTKSTE